MTENESDEGTSMTGETLADQGASDSFGEPSSDERQEHGGERPRVPTLSRVAAAWRRLSPNAKRMAVLVALLLAAALVGAVFFIVKARLADAEPTPDDELLTAADVESVSDLEGVAQVDISASPDAPYQAAYEYQGERLERLAIITVEGADRYEALVSQIEDGAELDIGDEALATGGVVYVRKGDRTITLMTLTHDYPEGPRAALDDAQLRELAGLVADRL